VCTKNCEYSFSSFRKDVVYTIAAIGIFVYSRFHDLENKTFGSKVSEFGGR